MLNPLFQNIVASFHPELVDIRKEDAVEEEIRDESDDSNFVDDSAQIGD